MVDRPVNVKKLVLEAIEKSPKGFLSTLDKWQLDMVGRKLFKAIESNKSLRREQYGRATHYYFPDSSEHYISLKMHRSLHKFHPKPCCDVSQHLTEKLVLDVLGIVSPAWEKAWEEYHAKIDAIRARRGK